MGGNQLRNPTSGGNTTALLENYLGELTCQQVKGLHARYLPDLALFQYSMDTIYPWVSDSDSCRKL